MVKFPHKRREQIWAYIHKNHHSVVEATNEKCETHYANLQRSSSFINRDFSPKPFKPPAKIDAATCASERILHENKQKELQQLITRGRAALQTLRDREVVARSERQAPADEERAAAHKAATEQKQARKEREQNRQHLADEEQSYRTNMIKLIDNLVKYHQEGIEQERALNKQLAALFHTFMQLIQQATPPAAQPTPPPID